MSMTGCDELTKLASLIKKRNEIDAEIAPVIGRPAHSGHIGEYVAAEIFHIQLFESASYKGIDGHFASGDLEGRSVNIKYYSKRQNVLDIRTPDDLPDFYLVLTGPRVQPVTSRGTTQPWVIDSVFLFPGPELVQRLRRRGVQITVGTSVAAPYWEEAEIYPSERSRAYSLTAEQRNKIRMFGEPN